MSKTYVCALLKIELASMFLSEIKKEPPPPPNDCFAVL